MTTAMSALHQRSAPYTPKDNIFKHDYSSKNYINAELALKAEREREEASAQQKAADEAKRLLDLEKEVTELRGQLSEAKTQQPHLKKEITELKAKLAEANKLVSQTEQDAKSERKDLHEMVKKLDTRRQELEMRVNIPKTNNLDPAWNGSCVHIRNVASKTAIDAGADQGVRAHGIAFDPTNKNQQFRLMKLVHDDPMRDPSAEWMIENVANGRYLQLTGAGLDSTLQNGALELPIAKRQCWWIGCDTMGKYFFTNVAYGLCIDLADVEAGKSNVRLRSKEKANVPAQWFEIIVKY